MPKPVILNQPQFKLRLTRTASAEPDEPTPLYKGTRQKAYTLACLPKETHKWIRQWILPLPDDVKERWGGVIEAHRTLAKVGLIDFDWVAPTTAPVTIEQVAEYVAESRQPSRITGLRSPIDGYARNADGVLDAAGRLQRQLDIFAPTMENPCPGGRKLIIIKKPRE